MGARDQQVEYSHILHLWVIMVVQNLQNVRSSGRFHGEREARAGAALPPWTGSLCERPESPRCWRTKPEREKRHRHRTNCQMKLTLFAFPTGNIHANVLSSWNNNFSALVPKVLSRMVTVSFPLTLTYREQLPRDHLNSLSNTWQNNFSPVTSASQFSKYIYIYIYVP